MSAVPAFDVAHDEEGGGVRAKIRTGLLAESTELKRGIDQVADARAREPNAPQPVQAKLVRLDSATRYRIGLVHWNLHRYSPN